jgi:hypothetical protein
MNGSMIIGSVMGAGVLYLWGWRRIRYAQAYWRYHRNTNRFERQLRDARDSLSQRRYRAARDEDTELRSSRAALDRDAAELCAHGFVELGDVIVCRGDQSRSLLRAFVDGASTTCAVLGPPSNRNESGAWVWLGCYRTEERFATWRGGNDLAMPPQVHGQALVTSTQIAELVTRHRALARTDEPDRDFARLTTLDELLAQFVTWDDKLFNWRAAQPADELLEADLRAVLGEHYDKVGKQLARRLRDELPQATALRV